MLKTNFFISLTLFSLFLSCKKSEEAKPVAKSNEAKLLTFNLKKDNNSTILSADVVGCINQNAVTLSSLIADLISPNMETVTPSFSLSKGAKLLYNGAEIESDKTAIKVTNSPTEIVVKAEDGTEQKYTLEITSRILNIQTFLNSCPTADPSFVQIMKDFDFKKNGIKMTILDFDCNNKMDRAMRLLQVIRLYFYIDLYKPKGYLPFTNLRLYDWLKAEVKGFDIRDDLSAAGACCAVDQGKKIMLIASGINESAAVIKFNYTEWAYLAGYATLIAHERRHADPGSYPHTGKCNDVTGDDDYNEANLGAYGVAYWLSKAFKTGVLDVGVSCLAQSNQDQINNLTGNDSWAARFFCNNAPPVTWKPNYKSCSCQ